MKLDGVAMGESRETIDELTLQGALMIRAPALLRHLARKIPVKMRGVIAAEDVLQELWITAFRGMSSFRPQGPDSLDRWLTTLAERVLINVVRASRMVRRGGGHPTILQLRDNRVSSMLDLFARISSPCPTPSSEAATLEAVHAVDIALASMPNEWRQVIWLRYIEGRTTNEIAKALKKTKPAVNGLLFRGMRDLRERLGRASKFMSGDFSSH